MYYSVLFLSCPYRLYVPWQDTFMLRNRQTQLFLLFLFATFVFSPFFCCSVKSRSMKSKLSELPKRNKSSKGDATLNKSPHHGMTHIYNPPEGTGALMSPSRCFCRSSLCLFQRCISVSNRVSAHTAGLRERRDKSAFSARVHSLHLLPALSAHFLTTKGKSNPHLWWDIQKPLQGGTVKDYSSTRRTNEQKCNAAFLISLVLMRHFVSICMYFFRSSKKAVWHLSKNRIKTTPNKLNTGLLLRW